MSDSDDFSDGSDSELETEIESDDEEEMVFMNQQPWVRALPPEPEDQEPSNFTENVGPKNMPPSDSKPISYFFLMVTVDLINRMVLETNRYAAQFIASKDHIRRFSRLLDWRKIGEVTFNEMKAFIAVILNMGLIRKANIGEYWHTTYKSQETSWFRSVFSRNRFQQILQFFHLVNNDDIPNRNDPNYCPAAKFQVLVDHFNTQSSHHLVPEQNISIDESLIATRGRCTMLQYIPSKSAKFGVKLWMLVEAASGYIYNMRVYRVKRFDPTPRGTTQGSYVINMLLESSRLLNKWYHVVCDSFFTSIDLAKQLLRDHTYITGTLKQNRYMPNKIKNPQLGQNDSIYMRQGELCLCSYKEKEHRKPVRILTTKEKAVTNIRGKPKVLEFYNKNMGGVDLADLMVTSYSSNRKSMKVWRKIVFNLIHRMDHLSDKEDAAANTAAGRGFVKVKLRKLPSGKQKECSVCSDRNGFGGRRRTRTICTDCHRGLHKDCVMDHLCVAED
ncbi:piggyBac transposable element-derived protein 4-like [Saccostrea cucullata]|uniref:piggyBac transposable element-derived protein 4-like n=1 Tax=Saccostrea cuccullata TaxID=36930 RepID=UPI002ED01921